MGMTATVYTKHAMKVLLAVSERKSARRLGSTDFGAVSGKL
ncbi:hypothetical protein Pd630_LPD07294 [Rhodococcus opacus PD630]|nr:hypothetical protein Pd630_LPD07294 [Rhodococcus opacus PD630]